jgi:peptide/nickel transport system substrate-binding protein
MSDDGLSKEYGQHLVEEVLKGRMTRRQLIVRASVFGLSASAIGSLLASCGTSSSSSSASPAAAVGTPKPGGTVTVGAAVPLTALDPITMYDTGGIVTVDAICEYLAWVENDLTLRPVLAESWSPDATAKVWTFKLRQGVTFHDGSPFTADDVVATFERLLNPKSGSSALSALKGILSPGGTVKVDDHTVAFHLDVPFADFPYLVSSGNYNSVILPKNYSGNFIKTPYGTGPFMLTKYVSQQSATLKKNPNYWQKGLPYLDGVIFKYSNDQQGQVLALQAGTIDIQAQTVYAGSQALFSDPNLDVLVFPSTGFRELAMRVDKPPFTDKRVRQAIAYSIDRPGLLKALFNGKGQLGNDEMFAPLYPLQPSPEPPQRAQDYAKAKALLAQAGHPNGIDITVTTEQYLEVPQYATLLQAMCKPAGINVKIQLMSYNNWYSGPNGSTPWLDAPMGFTDWAPRAVPEQFMLPMLTSNGIWNSSHWKNPEFDKLVAQYDASLDETVRRQIAGKIAALQQDETPVIVAYWIAQLRAISKKVHNVGGNGSIYLDLTRTYIS